ncbi:hypothetical protein ABKV19_001077 [Rosa sericea]
MADSGANPKQRQPKKNKKKRKQSGPEESERPPKTNRTNSSENENEPQDQNFEVGRAEKPNQGGPWRNLELILSIQNRELDLHKKVELAYGFVMSRGKEEGGSSDEDNQAVNMSRLIIFVSEWIQSLLISEGKKVESGGEKHQAEVIYTYLDLRCWEIFKFCLEESLKLNWFLRAHAARKDGFRDFSNKLLEPLLHLLGLLHLQIGGTNPGWMGNLLKLVEDVFSHGLYHPLHIDGFLSLCSTEKDATSNQSKDSKTINKTLSVFMHEKIYVRTEDASEGACLNFLKKVYNTIISLSSDLIQLSVTHSDSFTLIANEVLSAVGYLLEIEYDVLENDLVSLWLMMLSYLAIGLSLVDSPDRCSLFSKITDIRCQLIMLYSQLRQVNNTIFAFCKAIRVINLHNSDGELYYTRLVIPFHGEAYANAVEMLLSAHKFKIAIHKAMKSIPEGQASRCIQQLTLDISESLEWMKVSCSEADEKQFSECHLSSLHSFNLEAELFGRGLSEIYALFLESVIVTTGNCNLLGASIKELIRLIFPCMSNLVGPQQADAVNKFLCSVTVKDSDNLIARNKNKYLIFGVSTYWVVLFFFRLCSCRCLYRQAAILMPPDLSRKMSAEMGDSFSSFSGRDWMEMSDWINGGFFSWIVQPSASLLAVIRSVSNIFCKDRAADSCHLTYVMHAMACERLVDLNSRIKSLEYLIENGDNLVQVAEISSLRQEAAGLT